MEWYLSDHLGSTTLLINESGFEVERTEYYPYGEVQSGGLEKYGFTGQENDADTGLMYYGARYYSPEYRVFVQPDTMLPDVYNSQALNRYAYCLNNPVKYSDPTGHHPVLVAAAVVVKVGSAAVDYGLTANDIINDYEIITDPDACGFDKAIAGADMTASVVLEAFEPDEILPINLPLDDLTRKGVIKKAEDLAIKYVPDSFKYGHAFGKLGTYVKNPGLKVDWDKTTFHAAKRMEERGVSNEMVETWVKNGKALSQDNGNKYLFVTTEGAAVVGNDGKLITTWTKDTYDDQMKNVVNKLYGEQ